MHGTLLERRDRLLCWGDSYQTPVGIVPPHAAIDRCEVPEGVRTWRKCLNEAHLPQSLGLEHLQITNALLRHR